ncbi:MAG: hypothetical protein IRY99_16195 [Isosphaeraceae bacterium]|nr:hypothetical protein [Isosphaeraceae bacterium]
MGADAFHVYYGLRWEIEADAEDELSRLESEGHPRQTAAREHGLDSWWGITADEYVYFLLVGKLVGHFGWQHDHQGRLERAAVDRLMEETREKLRAAGLGGEPAWHFQFEPDR